MGFEQMKKGLHKYFKTYRFGNTSLYDFVNTLDSVWEESGDQSMGADFHFKTWFV